VFSHCVNCVLYKIYLAIVSPYSPSTPLNQRANHWRNVCIYLITTLVMLPHISRTGDTTHEASFHATCSIMLSIHAVLMAARSQKTQHQIFSNHHNKDIMQENNNSHTKLPQYQQYKINIFWKNLRLSLTYNHSHKTAAELCSIRTSRYKHCIPYPNKTKLTSNEM